MVTSPRQLLNFNGVNTIKDCGIARSFVSDSLRSETVAYRIDGSDADENNSRSM